MLLAQLASINIFIQYDNWKTLFFIKVYATLKSYLIDIFLLSSKEVLNKPVESYLFYGGGFEYKFRPPWLAYDEKFQNYTS